MTREELEQCQKELDEARKHTGYHNWMCTWAHRLLREIEWLDAQVKELERVSQ